VYCRQRHLSEKALRKSWSSSHHETLIERILEVVQISGVRPLGLSQQYETQRDSSRKVIYFEGGWLCSFVFEVTSSRFELKEDFSSLDIRVCPKSLLEKLRSDVLPIFFQPFTTAGSQEYDDVLLAALRSIAADPKVTVPVGGWVISPWIKWITSRDFSNPMVEGRETSSLLRMRIGRDFSTLDVTVSAYLRMIWLLHVLHIVSTGGCAIYYALLGAALPMCLSTY